MPIDAARMAAQVDGLLSEYEALRRQYDDLSDLKDQLAAFDVRLSACIDRLTPNGSSYAREASRHASQPAHVRVPSLVGVLRALKSDVDAGWLDDVAALVHADTFAEQLEQAEVLRSSGYKDAAAVVAGVALETHLRILAQQSGVSGAAIGTGKKKADVVNADLVKSGAYSTVQQKAVTAWLGIRNASAQGESSKFADGEVRHDHWSGRIRGALSSLSEDANRGAMTHLAVGSLNRVRFRTPPSLRRTSAAAANCPGMRKTRAPQEVVLIWNPAYRSLQTEPSRGGEIRI